MNEWLLAAGSALWLGLLTSLSPCPLATNVAALSFIGREVDRPRRVVLGGLCYAAGRTLTYVLLGAVLIAGLLSLPSTSMSLQRIMNLILGPLVLLTGIALLGGIRIPVPSFGRTGERMRERAAGAGLAGAGALGMLFALSFCPVSAALFFGSLIPLSLKQSSWILLPSIYGMGTALPVVLFAILTAYSVHRVAAAFDKLNAAAIWARRLTGVAFVLIGLYMTWSYTLS